MDSRRHARGWSGLKTKLTSFLGVNKNDHVSERPIHTPGAFNFPLAGLLELHLNPAFLREINMFARFCTRLKTCSIGVNLDHDCYWDPDIHEVKALLPLWSTLENLDIQQRYENSFQALHYLGDVPQFSALRSLRLAFNPWPGYRDASDTIGTILNLIPLGIEALSLEGRNMPVTEVAELLRKRIKEGQLPKLKIFQYNRESPALTRELRDRVAGCFEGMSVKCDVRSLDWEPERLLAEEHDEYS